MRLCMVWQLRFSRDQRVSLTPAEEAELLRLMERESKREPICDFISRITPRHPAPAHVEPVLELFRRAVYEPVRATVSMPPRFAKTETCMNGLAWLLYEYPSLSNAFLSGADQLARTKSRTIRARFSEAGGTLAVGAKAVDRWNTKQGGGLFCGGVGTHIQGMAITGVALLDDIVKGRKAAESRLERDNAWEWFNGDVLSRLEPGASVIVLGTRWHSDDLIGRLHSPDYESEHYEEINLPAVMDANGEPADERVLDEHGFRIPGVFREDVRSLWPEMRPLEFLEGRRLAGEYDWWSLSQGMPRPKGDKVFRDDPSRFSLAAFMQNELGRGGWRIILSVDPAATATTKADFSVAAVGAARGYGDDMHLFWLDVFRRQVQIPQLCRNLRALQQKWRVPIACEAVGAFRAVPDILLEADPNLVLLPVELKGDKFARSQPYAAAWNDGRVHTPIDAPWADAWLKEHADFTGVNDRKDDQVDAGAHGFTALLRTNAPRERINPPVGPSG